jgi:hypothetical protein
MTTGANVPIPEPPDSYQPRSMEANRPLTTTQAAKAYWETLVSEMGGDLGTQPTWEGNLRLEERAIQDLDPERLIRRAWIIRNRYREVAGEAKYSLYTASNPPALSQPAHGDAEKVDVKALRADLLEIHHELTREYIFGDVLEHQRGQLSRRATIVGLSALILLTVTLGWTFLPVETQPWAMGVMGLIVLIFIFVVLRRTHLFPQNVGAIVVALVLSHAAFAQISPAPQRLTKTAATSSTGSVEQLKKPVMREAEPFDGKVGPATTLTMVVMAGVLGATFSLIRRAQTPMMDGDAMRNVQNLAAADTYFLLTPLTGAIGALVLYAFFCGGLIEGSLFPKITCPDIAQPMRFVDFLKNAGPASWADHGKTLVWCFIAGFAERLVPDAIDRLTSAAQKK